MNEEGKFKSDADEITEGAIVELAEDVASNEEDISIDEEAIAELGDIAADVEYAEEAIVELGSIVADTQDMTKIISEMVHRLEEANATMSKGVSRLIMIQYAMFALIIVLMIVSTFIK